MFLKLQALILIPGGTCCFLIFQSSPKNWYGSLGNKDVMVAGSGFSLCSHSSVIYHLVPTLQAPRVLLRRTEKWGGICELFAD